MRWFTIGYAALAASTALALPIEVASNERPPHDSRSIKNVGNKRPPHNSRSTKNEGNVDTATNPICYNEVARLRQERERMVVREAVAEPWEVALAVRLVVALVVHLVEVHLVVVHLARAAVAALIREALARAVLD